MQRYLLGSMMAFAGVLAWVAGCSGDLETTSGDESSAGISSTDPLAALDLPETPYDYANIQLPPSFAQSLRPRGDNTPADNPVTNDGATLGRVLFYDTALSKNETVACASCHVQEHGFTDAAQFSVGFEGGLTSRNSMSLANVRFYRDGHFFWDERANTLEDQVLMPIQSDVEMGLTLEELVQRVEAQPYYPLLFEKAFGDPAITTDRISKALAQFVRSILSYRSRYDEGLAMAGARNLPFPNFTAQENQGKDVFLGPAGGCAACHLDSGPPPGQPQNQAIFFIDVPTNNGLDDNTNVADNGVGDVTGNPQQDGLFKSPSLRNIALGAPYMHDGRFATLAQVVEHYNSGVKPHPNLDPRLREPGGGPPRKLNLTPEQKAALVAFLKTLTDDALTQDPMYASPFRQ